QKIGSGGIRTHVSEETGALNQRLRPLGHATSCLLFQQRSTIDSNIFRNKFNYSFFSIFEI
ncbi:hypothetical protein ALC60_06744, partial [Trachymyrmex zeteki]